MIDISDPTAPAVISVLDQAPFDHDNVDVASLDSFLITASAEGGVRGQGASFGLHVYDTRDPAQPELMGTYKYEPTVPAHLYKPISVEAALGKALIASRRSVHFVDVDDPSNPMLLDALAYDHEVSAATLDEIGNVYVATVDGIVEVYEISGDRLSQTSRLALGRQPLGLVATDGQLVVVTAGNVTLEGGYHAQAQVFEQGEDGRLQETDAVALPGGLEVEMARAAIARGQMLIAMRGYGLLALGARPVVHVAYLPWLSLP